MACSVIKKIQGEVCRYLRGGGGKIVHIYGKTTFSYKRKITFRKSQYRLVPELPVKEP